ncbi:hypothetical protein ACLESD_51070 [Pyxidicoccus sp. 3LFB2]
MSQRDAVGVRRFRGRFLMPGLLLGLSFAGTSAAAEEGPDKPAHCKAYHPVVDIDFDTTGLHFKPAPCLAKGGTVRFINQCQTETYVKVEGPEWDALWLPPGKEDDVFFGTVGDYTVHVAEGCPGMPDDSRTGTLEVATGPGPGPIEGQ